MSNANLFRELQRWVAEDYPGLAPVEVIVVLSSGQRARLPVPPAVPAVAAPKAAEPFVPNVIQRAVLDALDGKAMTSTKLGDLVGDKRRLFKKPGGLEELRAEGLVEHHSRLGYYRPDSPPPELEEEEG